jgi:AraC-like DNA-binding protein
MQILDDLPENAVVRASALRPLLTHFTGACDDLPASLVAAFGAAGLDPTAVADGYARIPLRSYLAVFEEAARLADDPWLGARIGSAIRPGDLAPIGVLIMQSSSIWRGFQRLSRLITALQSRTEMLLSRDDDLVSLEYRVIGVEPGHYPQDAAFSLAAVCQLIRLGFDGDWAPEEVHLVQPVTDPQPLEQLLGGLVTGGQSANRIYCDAQQATRIVRSEDADLIAVILRHVGQNLLGAGAVSLAHRVRALIAGRLGNQPVTIAAIAAELGMTPRTLQRKLARSGQNIGALITQERRRLLASLEGEGIHSRAEIARRLGYADATVLWRARQSWPAR